MGQISVKPRCVHGVKLIRMVELINLRIQNLKRVERLLQIDFVLQIIFISGILLVKCLLSCGNLPVRVIQIFLFLKAFPK